MFSFFSLKKYLLRGYLWKEFKSEFKSGGDPNTAQCRAGISHNRYYIDRVMKENAGVRVGCKVACRCVTVGRPKHL